MICSWRLEQASHAKIDYTPESHLHHSYISVFSSKGEVSLASIGLIGYCKQE